MRLSEVLKHKNVDGKPYLCDIDEWLGAELPFKKLHELQDLLAEMQDRK